MKGSDSEANQTNQSASRRSVESDGATGKYFAGSDFRFTEETNLRSAKIIANLLNRAHMKLEARLRESQLSKLREKKRRLHSSVAETGQT